MAIFIDMDELRRGIAVQEEFFKGQYDLPGWEGLSARVQAAVSRGFAERLAIEMNAGADIDDVVNAVCGAMCDLMLTTVSLAIGEQASIAEKAIFASGMLTQVGEYARSVLAGSVQSAGGTTIKVHTFDGEAH